MLTKEAYLKLLSEIIAKQAIILGPDFAILKARNVGTLVIDTEGRVIDVQGDPQLAVQSLVGQYTELSGQIVHNALAPIFAKYPELHPQAGVSSA